MTSFKAGDIVAVEFPYSDLQGRKRRPGLVLSADDEDVLLARVTTRPAQGDGDVAILEWTSAGLPRPSTIRLAKLATVDRRLVLKRIGHISDADGANIVQALSLWLQGMAASLLPGKD